jgi:hypothetical protein
MPLPAGLVHDVVVNSTDELKDLPSARDPAKQQLPKVSGGQAPGDAAGQWVLSSWQGISKSTSAVLPHPMQPA